MGDNKKELPAGCAGCQSTLPCQETYGADPFVNRGRSPQKADPLGSAGFTGCKADLGKIAEELIGLGKWIEEYVKTGDGKLPMLWDLEEIVINYKKIIRPE